MKTLMQNSAGLVRVRSGRERGRADARAGFTLLEVILVLALVIALLAGVAGLSERVLAYRASTRAWIESQNVAEAVISSLERELSTSTIGDPSSGPGVKGDASSIRIVSRGVLGPGGDLISTELVFRAATGEVEGTRMPGGRGGREPMDPMLAMDAFTGGGEFDPAMQDGGMGEMDPALMGPDGVPPERLTERAVIGRGVQAIRFLYRDRDEWVESFDSLALGRLPLAVQVEVWFGEPEVATNSASTSTANAGSTRAVVTPDGADASATATASGATDVAVTYPSRAPDRVRVIAIPDAAAEAAASEGSGGGA